MGKTTLIKAIIERKIQIQPYFIVYHIDTKKRGDFSSRDGRVIVSEKAPPPLLEPGSRMVWQPLRDDKEEYSNFFLSILNAGLPAIVNIDEAVNFKFGSDSIPRGLEILLKQARLPGIHILVGTQEVARSPRQASSQADHIACFNLINEYDTRIMLERLGMRGERTLDLKRHEFLYRRVDYDSKAKKYTSYEDLLPNII